MERQPLKLSEIRGADVSLLPRTSHRVANLIQGTTRIAQVARELAVRFTGKPFGDISADRIHRVVSLLLRPEIACKLWPSGELEYFRSQLVSDSPDSQLRVMACSVHRNEQSTRDAVILFLCFCAKGR